MENNTGNNPLDVRLSTVGEMGVERTVGSETLDSGENTDGEVAEQPPLDPPATEWR